MGEVSVAVAAFVRTPGHSQGKTRLAAGVGAQRAAEFYHLALAVTEAVLEGARGLGLTPYWAVAEAAALDDPRWQALPRLWQGEGSLGERQDRVYRHLLASHSAALLIGADCPLLSPGDLLEARRALRHEVPFVLGPATDGGYYLFGGRLPVPGTVWTGVEYSTPETAAQLRVALGPLGAVALLPQLPDVDTRADLGVVLGHARAGGELSPQLQALIRWMEQLEGRGRGAVGLDASKNIDILEP